MSSDCPLARSEGLITEELDGELLVYDSETNLAHALAPDAAAVWRACDGRTDTQALAARRATSEEDVRNTLARLGELGLLEHTQADEDGDTRRSALRKLTLAGAGLATVPTISSILVPTAAQAASCVVTITEYPTSGAPVGITAGPDGALWFTEYNGDAIGRVTTSGAFTAYPIPTSASAPAGIAAGPDGALWFAEQSGNKIGRVTTSGAFTEYPVPTSLSSPTDITAGPDGALWFTETNASKIGRVTTAGAFTEYTIPTANSGPFGITAGPDGALWFTETNGPANNIGRVTTSGAFTEYPIPTPASEPQLITVGPDGALWFTEYRNANKIGRVTTSGAFTEYPIPTPLSFPRGIAAGPDGALWFTEFNGNKIGRINTC